MVGTVNRETLYLLRDSKTTKEGLRREVSNHIVHEEAVIEVRDSDQRVNHVEGKIGNRIRVSSVKGTVFGRTICTVCAV